MRLITSMLIWRQWPTGRILFLLSALMVNGFLHGQDNLSNPDSSFLIPESGTVADVVDQLRLQWELEGVESSLRGGLLGVATTLIDQLLERGGLSPNDQARLYNGRFQVALIRGDLVSAEASLNAINQNGLVPNPLFEAFLLYFTGDVARAEEIYAATEMGSLSTVDGAWFQLLRALILNKQGATEEANQAFLLAERVCPTALLRDQFEIIRFREELYQGANEESTIMGLRESVRSMEGERGGFEAARLLAIALHRSGQTTASIELLSDQLGKPGLSEDGLRSDFLLLLATISGPDSTRGRLALQQILSEKSRVALQSLALTLLVQSITESQQRQAFLQDVNKWLDPEQQHPLADRLLANRAFFLVEEGVIEEAEESAKRLLELYPSSRQSANALRLLAYTSWKQSPPRYRTAADYLNQYRQRDPDAADDWQIGVLIGDCYFLNSDFRSASNAYGAVLRAAPPAVMASIFYQRVLSEIGAGRPDAAAELIDEARLDARISEDSIWTAEWNLLDYLRREERTDEAYERIQQVLASSGGEVDLVSEELEVRFRWLSARLTFESGPPASAVAEAKSLLEELAGGEYPSLEAGQVLEIESHLLLLRGEAQIASGEKDAGLESFAQLRERFAQSGPAILSYLVESRSESDEDNLVSAQKSLIALVDRFPTSEFAPIALWEAALNAEQRGLNLHLQEAIGILERMVTEYPDHELVYFARLKQGDLARRLNDFPTALLLFERLLSLYPNHPERFRAELSRADCLMALGSGDQARYDQAAVIYERNCLLPVAPLPIRMESGFKWAHSLRQQGDIQGSDAVFWLLYERFVVDADLNRAIVSGAAGRYWVARILLELGQSLSEKGSIAPAKQIYETHLQMKLPGAVLAQARLDALQ